MPAKLSGTKWKGGLLQLLPGECDEQTSLALLGDQAHSSSHLPSSVAQAALARRHRQETAVNRVPARFPPEVGELCAEGRRWVRHWASGHISGQHFLLRLESCASVTETLKEIDPANDDPPEEEEMAAGEALLWGAGCSGLGGMNSRLSRLQEVLETSTPAQVLDDARKAVVSECGVEAESTEVDDLNWDWALRRIAARYRKASDAGGFALVQVWHELVRVHLSAANADDGRCYGDDCAEAAEEDANMLAWLQRSEEEAREAAKALPQEHLRKEAERLMDYTARAMLLGDRLRELVEGWTRFDAYRVLGVRRGASRSEVRRAFYRKALIMHPDKGGDKAAFQELQKAYDEVLAALDSGGADCAEEEAGAASAAPSPAATPAGTPAGTPTGWANAARASDSEDESCGTAESEEGASNNFKFGGAGLAEEEEKRLASLSRSATSCAQAATEVAERVLRYALAAQDALEEEPVAWDVAHENADEALSAARELVEAAKNVAVLAARAAGILSRCLEAPVTSPRFAEHSVDGAAACSAAVDFAVRACLRAINQATWALRRSRAEYLGEDPDPDDPEDSGEFVARLDSAISHLVETTRRLSVAINDAAETTEEAVLSVGVSLDTGEDGKEGTKAPDEADGTSEGEEDGKEKSEAAGREQDAAENSDSDVAPEVPEVDDEEERLLRKVLEARQQMSAMLEAVRTLKRTNRELMRLQRAARQAVVGTKAERGDSRAAEERCRERSLALLAEFLDEAVLGLQAGVREALARPGPEQGDIQHVDLANLVSTAIEESFGFVTRCSPELAMPQDPRTQTLRAAVVFDSETVRDMLGPQVAKRLHSSLMTALLDAACDLGGSGDAAGLDPELLQSANGVALEALEVAMMEAHERLATNLTAPVA